MKNFLLALFIGLGLAACEIRTSDNGDFDGLWQLASIDSLANGRSVDMRSSGEFWAVQVHLLQVVDRDNKLGSYIFRFDYEKKGTKLTLFEPRIYDKVSGDPEVKNPEVYKAYGINELKETFEIKELTSSSMVLESGGLLLRFKRF